MFLEQKMQVLENLVKEMGQQVKTHSSILEAEQEARKTAEVQITKLESQVKDLVEEMGQQVKTLSSALEAEQEARKTAEVYFNAQITELKSQVKDLVEEMGPQVKTLSCNLEAEQKARNKAEVHFNAQIAKLQNQVDQKGSTTLKSAAKIPMADPSASAGCAKRRAARPTSTQLVLSGIEAVKQDCPGTPGHGWSTFEHLTMVTALGLTTDRSTTPKFSPGSLGQLMKNEMVVKSKCGTLVKVTDKGRHSILSEIVNEIKSKLNAKKARVGRSPHSPDSTSFAVPSSASHEEHHPEEVETTVVKIAKPTISVKKEESDLEIEVSFQVDKRDAEDIERMAAGRAMAEQQSVQDKEKAEQKMMEMWSEDPYGAADRMSQGAGSFVRAFLDHPKALDWYIENWRLLRQWLLLMKSTGGEYDVQSKVKHLENGSLTRQCCSEIETMSAMPQPLKCTLDIRNATDEVKL